MSISVLYPILIYLFLLPSPKCLLVHQFCRDWPVNWLLICLLVYIFLMNGLIIISWPMWRIAFVGFWQNLLEKSCRMTYRSTNLVELLCLIRRSIVHLVSQHSESPWKRYTDHPVWWIAFFGKIYTILHHSLMRFRICSKMVSKWYICRSSNLMELPFLVRSIPY